MVLYFLFLYFYIFDLLLYSGHFHPQNINFTVKVSLKGEKSSCVTKEYTSLVGQTNLIQRHIL